MDIAALRERVGERALTWLLQALPHFDPFNAGPLPDEAAQTVLAEFALLVLLLRRHRAGRFARDNRLECCLDCIADAYAQPAFHEYVFRGHRQAFIGHLLVWAALHERPLPISRQQLQGLISAGNVTTVERTPYRTMELVYTLDLCGLRHQLPALETLFPASFAGQRFNIVEVRSSDIYALTHAVFYLTDYGARRPAVLAGEAEARLVRAVELLLGMMVHERHWDLVAELLLTMQCLGVHDGALFGAAWRTFAEAQGEGGDIAESPGLPATEPPLVSADPQQRFLALYHRSLTAALAAYLGCQSGD